MKAKKLNLVGRVLLAFATLVGGAKTLADPGYLTITNHLNSTNQIMETDRDNIHWPEATDGYDTPPDGLAGNPPPGSANICSVIPGYELWTDFRNEDSNIPYDLRLRFEGTLPSTQPNWLDFSFVYGPDWDYGNVPIIFQQTSSATDPEGNDFYPVYDVRDANELNDGVIPLKEVPVGTSDEYASGQLDIGTRLLADLDGNGSVNGEDYALFADGWRNNSLENHIGNISGPNGIPDYNGVTGNAIIDGYDLGRFSEGWLKDIADPNTW